jgi:UPF0755 protein
VIPTLRRARRALALAIGLAACGRGPAERVTVPAGASLHQVGDSLKAHHLVWSRAFFRLAARLKKVDRSIRAGIYEFPRGTSVFSILDALAAGRIVAARVTVPEGFTSMQIAGVAEERLGIPRDSFLAVVRDRALAESLGIPHPSLEGYLRPETYLVPANISARDLVRLMVAGFRESWDSTWTRRLDTLGMSQLEVLTLASIVEGEARVDSERETIAGVYRNRLRLGMPLQADPTVQYAIELATGHRKPRLYEKDYAFPSPYNTYLNPGLPPGPVDSPSERSIRAALYPAKVPYLYFVASPDGHHSFARSYEEHLQNVRRARREWAAAAAGQ